MSIQKQYEYTERYQKEFIRRVTVKLNRKTDQDILDRLEEVDEKPQTYIKRLIREDIKK